MPLVVTNSLCSMEAFGIFQFVIFLFKTHNFNVTTYSWHFAKTNVEGVNVNQS